MYIIGIIEVVVDIQTGGYTIIAKISLKKK